MTVVYGGELTGDSGELASPLFPKDYPVNADYVWLITVEQIKYIQVRFVSMEIEDNSDGRCDFDYVQVSRILCNF